MRRDTSKASVSEPPPERPKSTARPNNKRPVHPAIKATEGLVTSLMQIHDSRQRRFHAARALHAIAKAEHDEAIRLIAIEDEVHEAYEACESLVARRHAA